jgi:predicted O-methyltransferase YrrM
MANFITEKSVEQYLYDLLPPRDAVLTEMEERAKREHIPIVKPVVGRFLALLVELSGARRIFEMGSAIGYSTIWLARAAGPRGEVHYTDIDPERIRLAEEYIRRAGVSRRVRMHAGDAAESLAKTKGTFDMIFCDADKKGYPAALRLAVPRLRRGGLLITDNVLWGGEVAGKTSDPDGLAIQKFNRSLYATKELFPVILPLRDGVAICRKR